MPTSPNNFHRTPEENKRQQVVREKEKNKHGIKEVFERKKRDGERAKHTHTHIYGHVSAHIIIIFKANFQIKITVYLCM